MRWLQSCQLPGGRFSYQPWRHGTPEVLKKLALQLEQWRWWGERPDELHRPWALLTHIGRYKGVRRGISSGKSKIEVYDLETDMSEKTDIAAQHPELVEQVAALFKSEHIASKEYPLPGVDPGAKVEGKGNN